MTVADPALQQPALQQPVSQQEVHALYKDHHGWLYRWLRRKLGCSDNAADLAHDTFLRIMASRRLPSQLGGEPRALLTHIAKGLVIDHWRRQEVERAYREALALLPEPEAPSPETRLLILEALQRIETMLRDLPARTRAIFLLAQLDGLTYQQIADQLGTSLITVKRHMRTAFAACLALA
jgi:RNA polymerase sigma-70 factor (ECF subfamily)